MSGPTHITFALFMYLLLLTTTGIALNPVNAALIALASLLPDIDTGASSVGKLMPFISLRIERKFGHRTLTHSALFIAVVGLAALPLFLIGRDLYVCALAGYASHPFLDTMTVNGVKLFHPFSSAKCVFPLEVNNPHRYRIRTGGRMDRALGIIFFIACGPLFYVAYEGYERFIRATQQNIEAGVRDYEELSRDHLVFASVNAINTLTKQPLSSTVEVVGALNPRTLLFKGPDGRLHTMGRDFEADYTVHSILCAPGAPAKSSLRSIDAGSRFLSEVVSSLDTSAENYLFGDLGTSDRVSLPENVKVFTPVSGEGGSVRLNYATREDIHALNLDRVFLTKGILNVKTISTGAEGPATDRLESISGPGDVVRLRRPLDRKDSILILKEPGDSVRVNEIIARKENPRLYGEQRGILEGKINALRDRGRTEAARLEERVAEARQASSNDSAAAIHAEELLRDGFIAENVFRDFQLRGLKSKGTLSERLALRAASVQKRELELRALLLELRRLEAKDAAAERESEIRSPVTGLLYDIRRIQLDGKPELHIFIRPLR